MNNTSTLERALNLTAGTITGKADTFENSHSSTCQGLLDFTQRTKPDYQINWHHRVLAEHLDRFARGEVKRLMVFMPPRHGKSELVSRRLPAYILGINPDAWIIATSYGADLASRMNRDVQRIIDSPHYADLFPDTRLFDSNVRTVAKGTYLRNSDVFEVVNHRGGYRSAGVGGGITGLGFNFGIIDDPIKNRQDADSLTIRDTLWDWYTSTFYTRQEKEAGILITVTRWHHDDLCGRLLTLAEGPDGEQWTIISFPALAEIERHADDPREIGDVLWSEKYNRAALDAIYMAIGEYDWSALYQQSPKPKSGGLFNPEKIEIVDYEPVCKQVVRFYDLAATEKSRADYTVGLKLGITLDEKPVILDVWRGQKEIPDVQRVIVSNARADGHQVRIRLEAEKLGIVQLQYLLRDEQMRPFTIDAKPPIGDKYTRAGPIAARVNAGHVQMVRAPWNRDLLDELAMFPSGRHDDQVDTLSGAWDMLSRAQPIIAEVRRYA